MNYHHNKHICSRHFNIRLLLLFFKQISKDIGKLVTGTSLSDLYFCKRPGSRHLPLFELSIIFRSLFFSFFVLLFTPCLLKKLLFVYSRDLLTEIPLTSSNDGSVQITISSSSLLGRVTIHLASLL